MASLLERDPSVHIKFQLWRPARKASLPILIVCKGWRQRRRRKKFQGGFASFLPSPPSCTRSRRNFNFNFVFFPFCRVENVSIKHIHKPMMSHFNRQIYSVFDIFCRPTLPSPLSRHVSIKMCTSFLCTHIFRGNFLLEKCHKTANISTPAHPGKNFLNRQQLSARSLFEASIRVSIL